MHSLECYKCVRTWNVREPDDEAFFPVADVWVTAPFGVTIIIYDPSGAIKRYYRFVDAESAVFVPNGWSVVALGGGTLLWRNDG